MVTKYFSIHSQNERQGLCHPKISLSVDDKACMRPITGVFYLSQLGPRVLPWITFVLLTDIFLNLGVNPLETVENYSIQFVVSLRWNTITIRTPAFWGYPTPAALWLHKLLIHIGSKQDKVKATGLKNLPKVQIFEFRKKTLQATHLLQLVDKMCRYKMDIRRVLLKIQSRHSSIDRRTDGQVDRWTDCRQGETSITPINFVEVGYNNIQIALPLTSAPVLIANNDAYYIYICIYITYIYVTS